MISKFNTVKDFEVPEFIIIMPITKLPNWQKFEKKFIMNLSGFIRKNWQKKVKNLIIFANF